VVGHINIGNKVKIAAQSGVINDVEDGKEIAGTPGIDANTAKRAYSLIEYLPEIRKKIRTVEKRLARLEKPAKS
jgi:UDP-3-O-[3-hydroxymyristoyl] glucosamine N-acyltransferase